MNARRNHPGTTRTGLRGTRGYSLIEMIIALAMAVIISMGIYAIFNAQQRSSRAQKDYNNLQTTCNFAMDTIKNDLLMAGYNARSSTQPIKAAADHSIQFEFFDQNAGADESVWPTLSYSQDTRVTLALTGTTLTKTLERWHKTNANYQTPITVTLARNIQALDFAYLKENNEAWQPLPSVNPTNLNEIREIRVGLRCRAEKSNAIFNAPQLGAAPQYQEIALTTEVRPRNVNIARNPDDKTPPAVPGSKAGQFIKAWDEGTCGCLKLNWSSNTDSDIAGYMIFYGLAPGSYVGRARVDHLAGATQTFQLPDLPSSGVPYYIALSAFDASGNQSGISAEISGNPSPSIRTLAGTTAGNDTAITPLPPAAPVGLVVSTPADQQLIITWSKTYTDCMTLKTFGYRLYRSTDPNFVPSGTSAGYGNCIADETTLGPDTVSYLDRGLEPPTGHLVGCVPYYYKLAVVNCDPTQISNFTDPGMGTTTNYTAAQFATIAGTPTDGTPTNAPILTSVSGWRRIIVSVTNPSRDPTAHPDFVATRIYFSKSLDPDAAGPQLTTTRDAQGYLVVNGGTLIPDRGDPAYDAPGEVSNSGGPWAINFDDERYETPSGGIGNPQLDSTMTYHFLAVSYDRCKNAASNEMSQTAAKQCADGMIGEPWRDAPPQPENVRITRGCDGRPLKIEWDYPSTNYTSNPDFQGFRVVRCTGSGCIPIPTTLGGTGTIIGSTTYLTPDLFVQDDTVDDGLIYNYRVYAGDCWYQRWLEGDLSPAEMGLNPPQNNASFVTVPEISLGYFGRAQVTGDATTTLTAALLPATDTIPVVNTAGFTRNTFQIGGEVIECTVATPTSFTGCVRGAQATIATPHFAGDVVTSYPPAPPRAAVSGDLSLNPATFQHNVVKVAARNTAAAPLIFRQIDPLSWINPVAWLKKVLYLDTVPVTLYDGATLSTPAGVTLFNGTVTALANDKPVALTFLRQDGTLTGQVTMRNDELSMNWKYQNYSTQMECNRLWEPPNETKVGVPEGPTVYGTAQSKPFAGTLAWPVPGTTNNPKDAVVVPAGSQVRISTYVQNNAAFGTSIASAYLYYYAGAPTLVAAPNVTSAYPACTPYTMEEMTNVTGTTLWYADIPGAVADAAALNNKSIWYFIVAVDSEGNFGRAPDIGAGAFQYFQRPPNPCTDTPMAPVLNGTVAGSTVTLDWSASWTGTPTPTYKNTDGSDISDLAGFKIYRQVGTGTPALLATTPDPLPPTTQQYNDTLTTVASSLVWQIDATTTGSAIVVNVTDTAPFFIPGKLQVESEVFFCNVKTDAWHLGACTRALNGTTAVFHPAGAVVTQDVLALMNVNYTMKAFDNCTSSSGTPTPNFSGESNPFTAFPPGGCSPACDLQVSPANILPGGSFDITATVCAKALNATVDTIYVQGCSACDDDEIEMRETGPSTGVFRPYNSTTGAFTSIATQVVTTCTGGGGNWTLTLTDTAASTISVGGWSGTPGTWGSGTCSSGPFVCGNKKTISVTPVPPDPCVGIATPSTPSLTAVTPTNCNANANWGIGLTWTGDAPSATLFYRVYECSNNNGTAACTLAKIAPTGVEPPATAQTTLTYTFPDTSGAKANSKEYWFQVEAVNTKAGCTDTTRWPTAISTKRVDSCP
jgi:prepilin-type N-terminal cleavage/methylation domain-containing protein